MQTLAAYVIFLLFMVAVGLAIIFGAVVALAVYEGIDSIKSRPEFRTWERSMLERVGRACLRIENHFHVARNSQARASNG